MPNEVRAILIAVGALIGTIFLIPRVDAPVLRQSDYVINTRTKATMEEKKANKIMAKDFAWVGYGWRGKEWKCIYNIFDKESRFDHLARSTKSTAFGIGQMLGEKSYDPAIQILRAYGYIEHRYNGKPCQAWAFHMRYNHY